LQLQDRRAYDVAASGRTCDGRCARRRREIGAFRNRRLRYLGLGYS
jgi:hypothetical protein